jgi:hypothetical protein
MTPAEVVSAPAGHPAWPSTAVAQIQALTSLLATKVLPAEEVVQQFEGVKAPVVQRHLDTLVLLGELSVVEGRYYTPEAAGSRAASYLGPSGQGKPDVGAAADRSPPTPPE